MAIKLIALDLDGTLLTDDKTVSKGNRDAIKWAAEQGIEVAFATGRSMGIIPPDVFNIKEIRYIITSDGAVISDRMKGVLSREFIPESAIDMIVSQLEKRDDMIEVFVGGVAHVQRHYNEQIQNAVRNGEDPYYYVYHRESEDDIIDFIKKNRQFVELIIVSFPRGEDPRTRIKVQETVSQIPGIHVSASLSYNMEMVSAKAGKGNALIKLSQHLGLKKEEIMSMGDSMNDMTMPEVSGVCVAMGNARDEVKERADFVTGNNMDNGVATAIYQIVTDKKHEVIK